ncbi:hypothetical protein HK105_201007 [Polyrhizophydium stewartii]|uniref:Uncharacterized protein n=1 Tax=Polyrhizophydium stewartii TaxID=2732419 RepID=A0ABR4NIR3_9FUNG
MAELKGQREWSQKWQALNDPRLFLGEDAPVDFPQKSKPTKWSAYSVINPPGRFPVPEAALEAIDPHAPCFKITGDRERYLTSRRADQAFYTQTLGGSIPRAQQDARHPATTAVMGTATTTASASAAADSRHTPVFHLAPFATNTPVSPTAVSHLQKHQRASLSMFNAHLVGARAGSRAQFVQDPQSTYRFPPTSSMEYGWRPIRPDRGAQASATAPPSAAITTGAASSGSTGQASAMQLGVAAHAVRLK